ncbi:MAG TPA: hypothetical protein VHC69_33795 [Polyangiaceae bacterium]|nr:hypothetical protein [Polyangiaceae bacterium]
MAVPLSVSRVPAAYRQWNEVLAEELFPRGRAGIPVRLAVHDGLLNECGARHGLGGRDEFVRAVLGIATAPERIFMCLESLAELWSENGRSGAPPVIAGLAFAVLAAGEMDSDANARQTNYYIRLNALMGVENRGKPDRFEGTPELWRLLQEWLRSERRGELAVRLDTARPFVDPVQSQCLVRSCDLAELAAIVQSSARLPGQFPEPDEVVPAMRLWLLRGGRGSRLSRLIGRDPDDSALLQAAEALCDALEDYSGAAAAAPAAVDRDPRAAALAIRPNRYPNLMWKRAQWLLRLDASAEAEESECLVLVGNRVAIGKLDVREPAAYDAEATPEEAAGILRGNLRVFDEDEVDVTPSRGELVWFQDGALRGRPGSWNVVDTPDAGIEQTVVALAEQTLTELDASLEGAAVRIGDGASWPGSGLFGASSAVPRENAVLPGDIAVRPRVPLLRLSGGLRLRRGVYLRGGLPHLVAAETASVSIESADGQGASQLCTAGTFPSLDLAEGRYALRCDGATAELFVVEPRWRECAAPEAADLDRQVEKALAGASVRGGRATVQNAVYATYFAPGTKYRLYAPNVVKATAPPDGGIHEHRTAVAPRQTVLMSSVRAPYPVVRADCFSEDDTAAYAAVSEGQREAFERLLEYLSARGSGGVDAVRQQCAAAAAEDAAWHSVLSTLEDLGHVDVCWEARRWCIAPPLAFPRADGGGCAIVTGARSRQSIGWLAEKGISARLDPAAMVEGRLPMPGCITVAGPALAAGVLAEVGGQFLPESPSVPMAVHTRAISDTAWWIGPEFSPPAARIAKTLRRWLPQELCWRSVADMGAQGLYQWREQGRRTHYLVSDGIRAIVRDSSAAKWFLAPRDRSYLGYEPGSRRLLVPRALELPRIWKRICTIASGLTPVRQGRLLAYEGIPLALARAAAVRLNQSRMEGLL